MRSNYRKLGEFIREVNIRNADLSVDLLLGVSIQKIFIPSIANTIGTNMTNYKIVEKGQFVYGTVTSRNGDKVSIALLEEHEKAIVSQAYKVFEIVNHNELLPEYLMMWFKRPEFDRYARFHSHGSAREIFDWQDMCEVELPVPDIQTQQAIVDEYQAVQRKIALNEQLISKLEETAQTIYQQWFVDGIDIENLPDGWKIDNIGNMVEIMGGGTPSTKESLYWKGGNILWYSPTDLTKNDGIFSDNTERKITSLGLKNSSAKIIPPYSLLMTSRATIGKLTINTVEATTNQGFIVLIPRNNINVYILYSRVKSKIENIISLSSGSTFLEISKSDFKTIDFINPPDDVIYEYTQKITPLFNNIRLIIQENNVLGKMKDLLLSKIASGER